MEIRIEDLFEHLINEELLLFAALGTEPKNGSFAILKVIFDLQIHDGADPAARVGERGKQALVSVTNDVSGVD